MHIKKVIEFNEEEIAQMVTAGNLLSALDKQLSPLGEADEVSQESMELIIAISKVAERIIYRDTKKEAQ